MKKIVLKRIISVSSLVIVLAAITLFLQEYLFCLDDSSAWRVRGFYLEEENSLDVVLVGASDVFTGFSSALAYEKYGFTSYPLASDSASVEIWKSEITEIYKRQRPQKIVIEITGALYADDNKLYDNIGFRKYVDGIPFSINKINTLMNAKLSENTLSYCFPIIKYHSDYGAPLKNLNQHLYYANTGYAKYRGFSTKTTITDGENIISPIPEKEYPLNKNAKCMLIEFLEFCKQMDYNDILFASFPHLIVNSEKVERRYRCNTAKRIINDYGFDYVDLENCYSEINLDIKNDFYSPDHLNVFGAEKFTEYFGRLLVQNYSVKPHNLSTKQIEEWKDSVEVINDVFSNAKQYILNGKEIGISEDYANKRE